MIKFFIRIMITKSYVNYIFEISNNLKYILELIIILLFTYFMLRLISNTCVKIAEIRNFKKRIKNKGKVTSSVSEINEDD